MEAREYQKAIDCLCGLIEDGQLTVGDKLPTERALAEQLGISRNSTREALRALENLGVVERRQGSGSYLVGNTTKTIQPMIDMMLLLGQTSQLEICDRVEEEIRQNSYKLMSAQAQAAARAAGRAPQETVTHAAQPQPAPAAPRGIDVSADDFDDED